MTADVLSAGRACADRHSTGRVIRSWSAREPF